MEVVCRARPEFVEKQLVQERPPTGRMAYVEVHIIQRSLLMLLRHHGRFATVHRNGITTAAAEAVDGGCPLSVAWISSVGAREGKRPNEWWNSAGAHTDQRRTSRKHFLVGLIVHPSFRTSMLCTGSLRDSFCLVKLFSRGTSLKKCIRSVCLCLADL